MENITIKGLDIPAIYHPCNRGNYGGSRPLSAIKYIVIHYTANLWDSAKSNLNYFANNVVKASANYFVDSKTIGISVPDECYAWHCGGGLQGVGSHKWFNICNNWNSIGIEICHDKKTGDYYPDEDTYRNVVQLTAYLMKKYNVPIENVIRHWDVTAKSCPKYWAGEDNTPQYKDWLKFKEAVEEEVAVRYKTINEVPDSIRKEVKEVIDAGCLKGNGEKGIDMTFNELRVLVICLRIVKFFTGKK